MARENSDYNSQMEFKGNFQENQLTTQTAKLLFKDVTVDGECTHMHLNRKHFFVNKFYPSNKQLYSQAYLKDRHDKRFREK